MKVYDTRDNNDVSENMLNRPPQSPKQNESKAGMMETYSGTIGRAEIYYLHC